MVAGNATTAPGRSNASASAYLGGTLRTILIAPTEGFAAVLAAAARRAKAGHSPAEGFTPTVLAALGGAQTMLLWLKLGSLLQLRRVAPADFQWTFLIVSAVAGGVLGVALMWLWGPAGRLWSRLIGGQPQLHDLRMVWGASSLPQAIGLVVLLPLDLLIVGPSTFTSQRLTDSLATTWAAISIALSVSLAVWSVLLFLRGSQEAAKLDLVRGLLTLIVAGLFMAGLLTLVIVGARTGAS